MLCEGKDRRLLARNSTVVLALQLAPKDRKRMEMLISKLEGESPEIRRQLT